MNAWTTGHFIIVAALTCLTLQQTQTPGAFRLKQAASKSDVKQKDELDEVRNLLLKQGYISIPLECLGESYVTLKITTKGKTIRVVLDSGAPCSSLDPERTKSLNLQWNKVQNDHLPTKSRDIWDYSLRTDLNGLQFGELRPGIVPFHVINLNDQNKSLKSYGHELIDGLIGNDFLTKHLAWIDYPGLRLYLK